MLRTVLLATAMTVAVPALAQTTTPATQDTPAAAPMQADPATPAADTAPATPATAAIPAESATAATPAATGDQITQVVTAEFPSYDKDANGNLDQAEFAAWMVALKTASDPATKAESTETRTWVGAAFAQADKDKSKSVTQTELTGFLSQGAS